MSLADFEPRHFSWRLEGRVADPLDVDHSGLQFHSRSLYAKAWQGDELAG